MNITIYTTHKHLNKMLMCLLLFISVSNAKAQFNLVPNYSFEQYTVCPVAPNSAPPPWYIPSTYINGYVNLCSTSPYTGVPYNSAGNYQYAHSGDGYIGIFLLNNPSLNRRNYYQTKLKDSLRQGKCYYAEFYTVSADNMNLLCNNIAILLSKTAIYVDTANYPYGVLSASPQIYNYGNPIIKDTQNWVKVSSVFIANGGEQYLTFGNFKKDNQTNYINFQSNTYNGAAYLIDDVSVIPLDSMPLKAAAGKDTSIANVGDSVFIGSLTNGLTGVKWYDANNNEITSKAGVPGFYAKPTASTFYIIEQTVCGYYSRDTVNVTVGTVPLKFISYNLISSLRGTKQSLENTWTTANEINVSHFNIQRSINVKDFITKGKVVAQNKIANEYSFIDNELPITTDQLTIYYRIESVDKDGRKQYSTTQQINTKHQTPNIALYPNPAKDYINVSSNENIKEIKIINQLSQIVQHQTPNTKQITINTKQFAKGLYIVQCTTNKGEINIQKLIIE